MFSQCKLCDRVSPLRELSVKVKYSVFRTIFVIYLFRNAAKTKKCNCMSKHLNKMFIGGGHLDGDQQVSMITFKILKEEFKTLFIYIANRFCKSKCVT